ncbi:MAG: chemotaxis protein CheA [Firmicutes bacterium]|nr:chemotaxis protein CheA [Bacillota bacterium]
MFSDDEVSVFFDELEEKIQVLNENLLLIEREGSNDEAIQEIFRAAHTIKGSSAVMGYEKMAALTHEMESVFDLIRSGKMKINGQLMNILFQALDTLQNLRDEMANNGAQVQVDDVVALLKGTYREVAAGDGQEEEPDVSNAPGETLEAPPPGQLDDVVEDVIRDAAVKGYQPLWITVYLDPGTQMKAVRAYMVLNLLEQYGEIIRTEPPADDLQEGRFEHWFRLLFLTAEDPDRIHGLLMTANEVSRVEVRPAGLKEEETAGPGNGPGAAGGPSPGRMEKPGPAGEETALAPNGKNAQPPKKGSQTVRIDVQKLDNLMNLVGELVIERTRLNRFTELFAGRFGRDSNDLIDIINEISSHLGQVTGDLQEQIMKARMLPVAQVFNRFPRMVRDLAQKMGKEVDFVVEGHETELDRNVIEIIGDPLIHLIRNALDHGLEAPEERAALGKPRKGLLKLKASYMENNIVITVEDDGRGIDTFKIRNLAVKKGLIDQQLAGRLSEQDSIKLIFAPGFSTSENVTDLSGRGVGMDIVRNQIESINGTVEVASAVGKGSLFTIKLPFTLAITRALMVELDGDQFAIPLLNVQMTLHVQRNEIKRIRQKEVVIVRGRVLPLVRLADVFERSAGSGAVTYTVVILGVGEKRVGLVVDRLLGEQEIVIKSLGSYLGKVPGLSGATILGDGRVALIVDVRQIVKELGLEEVTYAAN